MLRVCCVICCYASTSGMWIHSLFYSGFLPSCQKRTNNPVNNRQHSLKQCVTRWRKEVCLVFFFRIRKCYRVRFINAFILRFCVKTYSEWLDGWLVGWRERMGMGERRDYVNEILKKSAGFAPVEFLPVLLLLFSPWLSPSAAWVILFQQHPCLREAWSPQTQTKHRQKHQTCHVPAREPEPSKLSLFLGLSPFTLCFFLPLSFTHKLRVQTKSQQSPGHNRRTSSCRCYHSRLITWMQDSR